MNGGAVWDWLWRDSEQSFPLMNKDIGIVVMCFTKIHMSSFFGLKLPTNQTTCTAVLIDVKINATPVHHRHSAPTKSPISAYELSWHLRRVCAGTGRS